MKEEVGTDAARAAIADAPNLRSLIERLEAATEGSRELDYAIAETIGRETVRAMQGTFAPWKYTTSIDAALKLVPEGLYWVVTHGRTRPDEPLGCTMLTGKEPANEKVCEAEGATAALATCIAALKARQASVEVAQRAGSAGAVAPNPVTPSSPNGGE